jgi:hypothetical protein
MRWTNLEHEVGHHQNEEGGNGRCGAYDDKRVVIRSKKLNAWRKDLLEKRKKENKICLLCAVCLAGKLCAYKVQSSYIQDDPKTAEFLWESLQFYNSAIWLFIKECCFLQKTLYMTWEARLNFGDPGLQGLSMYSGPWSWRWKLYFCKCCLCHVFRW